MEVTSDSPGKRSRAKVKSAATEEKKPTIVVKKARTPKKVDVAVATVTTAPAPAVRATATQPSVDQIQAMISTAAYYLAAERHFSPGHELDDWLEAERRIHALYG
jgi:Protein of unknown function (DUF2934)